MSSPKVFASSSDLSLITPLPVANVIMVFSGPFNIILTLITVPTIKRIQAADLDNFLKASSLFLVINITTSAHTKSVTIATSCGAIDFITLTTSAILIANIIFLRYIYFFSGITINFIAG